MPFLIVFFRWLHVITACVAIGSVFFVRLLLPVGLRVADDSTRHAAFLRCRRALKLVIHPAILLFLISGIFNSWRAWDAYKTIPTVAHPLWGTHVLLAAIIFAIALYVLAGAEPPAGHRNWMLVTLVLLVATVAVASTLKYEREKAMKAAAAPARP